MDTTQTDRLVELRRGARTIGLFATRPGVGHAFGLGRQVLVKIYKGDGNHVRQRNNTGPITVATSRRCRR